MTNNTNTQAKEPTAPTNPDVFDVEGAARYLNLAERTVRLRLGDGSLPGWKLGGVWRISRLALDEHMRTANAGGKKAASAKKAAGKK